MTNVSFTNDGKILKTEKGLHGPSATGIKEHQWCEETVRFGKTVVKRYLAHDVFYYHNDKRIVSYVAFGKSANPPGRRLCDVVDIQKYMVWINTGANSDIGNGNVATYDTFKEAVLHVHNNLVERL